MDETSSRTDDREAPRSSDPVIDAYKVHVDMTLIREQLRRTIDQRVARMIAGLRLAEELRAANRR